MSEDRIDVQLLAPHSHLGERKKVGEVISVTTAHRDWLLQRGIATVINPETTITATATDKTEVQAVDSASAA